jgi:hypothetical protein
LFRLFECCALSFFERFVLSLFLKIERFVSDSAEIWICGLYTCSPLTVSRIEKGAPTVAIGIYLRVLYALQLDDDILLLAQEDVMGKALQDMNLKKRGRASKKE